MNLHSGGRAIFHCVRYFLGLDAADTQTTVAERACLARHAQGKRRVVELGVYEGVSTRLLLDCMAPGGTLFGVDPFVRGRLGICWGRVIAGHQVRRRTQRKSVVFLESTSREAARELQGSFDLVFVDADHSFEGISGDWTDWAPRIVPGGIMAMHDTCASEDNPMTERLDPFKYFETHVSRDRRFQIVEQIDTLGVLRRCQ